jgi:hypothetical protein
LTASAAFAQSSGTASAIPITAHIGAAITVSLSNGGLVFGDIFPSAAGGSVVLSPATDLRTATGGLTLGTSAPFSSAVLNATGTRNGKFSITVPANGTVTLTGPGTAMPVNDFSVAVGAALLVAPFTSQFPNTASAKLSFKVGGTLVVGASQVDGDYTGTFAVTIAYN